MATESDSNFAAIISGVVPMLGEPNVPVSELADAESGVAFPGCPFDGAMGIFAQLGALPADLSGIAGPLHVA